MAEINNQENLKNQPEIKVNSQDKLKVGEFTKNLKTEDEKLVIATLDSTLIGKGKIINQKLDNLETRFA